mmetsp:Transcript_19624/g.59159  ORF Transcript_19624/g.59159 Transcript_19624/m.59159 type:complete len:242 (-) Transcript_19624:22-747(-)
MPPRPPHGKAPPASPNDLSPRAPRCRCSSTRRTCRRPRPSLHGLRVRAAATSPAARPQRALPPHPALPPLHAPAWHRQRPAHGRGRRPGGQKRLRRLPAPAAAAPRGRGAPAPGPRPRPAGARRSATCRRRPWRHQPSRHVQCRASQRSGAKPPAQLPCRPPPREMEVEGPPRLRDGQRAGPPPRTGRGPPPGPRTSTGAWEPWLPWTPRPTRSVGAWPAAASHRPLGLRNPGGHHPQSRG